MRKIKTLALLLMATMCIAIAENLTPYGDFEAEQSELKQNVKCGFERLSFIKETPGDNHCAKVEITKVSPSSDGMEGVHANIVCSFKAKPNTKYQLAFDMKGVAPRFLIAVQEETGNKPAVSLQDKYRIGASYYEIFKDWTEYSGSFRTTKGGKCTLTVTLWHNTIYGKMFYAIGDFFLIDNIRIWE